MTQLNASIGTLLRLACPFCLVLACLSDSEQIGSAPESVPALPALLSILDSHLVADQAGPPGSGAPCRVPQPLSARVAAPAATPDLVPVSVASNP
jgi:hypothetical protein